VSLPAAVYRPRNPQLSDYYRCVEDYFETFVRVYEEYFPRQYGFWRPYVEQVIYRYLDCGDPHNGFARVRLVLALKTLELSIMKGGANYLVDVDIKGSFAHVDHKWLMRKVKRELAGRIYLIRYADDFVIGCANRKDAQKM
jgi:hypothetical protein